MINTEEIYDFIDWYFESDMEMCELARRYPSEFNAWYFANTNEDFGMNWVKNH